MKWTKEMSKEARKCAEDIEGLICSFDIPFPTLNLLRRLIEAYGIQREADGFSYGKIMAGQERREEYLATASYYEQRNKELMSDILAVISEHRRAEVDDDIPF